MVEKLKTEVEILTNLRNEVYEKIIINKANRAFWIERKNQFKKTKPEHIEAKNKIQINEENIEADELFIVVIDKQLKEAKERANAN